MTAQVDMPVITASGEEAVVTAWFIDEGGACREGQMIAEVQAEKISAEVEAPESGIVVDRVAVSVPVPQGEPICRIVSSVSEGAPESATEAESEAAPGRAGGPEKARVAASPSAKRLARELGVPLQGLTGTGPGGRITEADVRAAAPAEPTATESLRAVIARNMLRSAGETAAVTLHSTVDLGPERPVNITATIVKVVAETLEGHPRLNGRREGEVFTPAETPQIALAIQTEEGLVAPVVRDPGSRAVEDIAVLIEDLAKRAAAKTLTAEDYEGGTFTVTNLGAFGVDGFTPIINLPQVAILGVGAVRLVPAFDAAGTLGSHHQIVLSLTFDHAFIDGAPAAAFLRDLGEALSP